MKEETFSFNVKPQKLPILDWRKQWGVFDWTSKKEYPTALKQNNSFLIDKWRWEFLRRDPRYREDYYQWRDDETASVKVNYFEYGLTELINPSKPYNQLPENFSFKNYPLVLRSSVGAWNSNLVDGEAVEEYDEILERDKNHTVDVCFDLRRGIIPQTNRAAKILVKLQEIKKRQARGANDLLLHLRVLDAHQAGASTAAIIDEFFSNNTGTTKQKVSSILKRAKKLWHIL